MIMSVLKLCHANKSFSQDSTQIAESRALVRKSLDLKHISHTRRAKAKQSMEQVLDYKSRNIKGHVAESVIIVSLASESLVLESLSVLDLETGDFTSASHMQQLVDSGNLKQQEMPPHAQILNNGAARLLLFFFLFSLHMWRWLSLQAHTGHELGGSASC